MWNVCVRALAQPSKFVFRVNETSVFTNATRPSKEVKLILKATLLELILASEVDLDGV